MTAKSSISSLYTVIVLEAYKMRDKKMYIKPIYIVFVGLVCGFISSANANIASTQYAQDASNISSGTLGYARLPVGTTTNTVAAGNDVRFNTISTAQPSGSLPTGTAFMWFE